MKLVHRALSACLGLSLLSLGGCGGDEAATSNDSSSSSSSSESAAPAAPSAPGGSGGTPGMNATGMMPPGDLAGSGGSGGMDPAMAGYTGAPGSSDPAAMGAMDPAMDPAMMEQYGNMGPGGASRQPKKPKKKPEEWTELDITAGIEQRDPEVVPAIDLYSDDKQGDEATSQGIVTWLAILSQPKKDPPKIVAGGAGAAPGSSAGGSSSGAGAPLGSSSSSGASADPATDPSYIDPAMMEAEYNGAPGAEMYGSGSMMPGGQPGANKKKPDDRIAEALIDALIETHTLVSYQAARDILRGDLKIGIDIPEHKVAGWTMASLLKHQQTAPDPAAKILRQALLSPEQFRSGGGDFDASRLEKQAVLEHVAGAIGTIDGLMGLRSSQLHAPAKPNQNQMYGAGAGMDPTMMTEPGGYNGAPGEPGSSGGPAGGPQNQAAPKKAAGELDPVPKNLRPINFTGPQALAAREYLWNPELVKYVHQGLSQSDSLMKDPELVLLAGQLPVTETRQALRKFLTDQWEMNKDWTRNPASLIREQVFAKHMRDPGLLVTLKSLPRMAHSAQNQGGGYDGALGGSGGGEAPRRKSKHSVEEEQAMQSWNRATSEYMLALMDRAKDASQTEQHQPHNEDELDVRLHRDAQITADFRLELVLGNPPPEGEIDLRDRTVLNYVRIESNQMDNSTVRHYKSALRKEDEYPLLNGNVLWLDYSGKSAHAGEFISIDVLLSKSGARGKVKKGSNDPGSAFAGPGSSSGADAAAYNGAPGAEGYGGGGGQDFVVEILTVRIPDPNARVRQVTTAEN